MLVVCVSQHVEGQGRGRGGGRRSMGQLQSSSVGQVEVVGVERNPESASRSAAGDATGRGAATCSAPRSVPDHGVGRGRNVLRRARSTSTARPRLDAPGARTRRDRSGIAVAEALEPLLVQRRDDGLLGSAGRLREGELQEQVEPGVAVAEGESWRWAKALSRARAGSRQARGERLGARERSHGDVEPSARPDDRDVHDTALRSGAAGAPRRRPSRCRGLGGDDGPV